MIFVPLPFLVTLFCTIFVVRGLAAARSTGDRNPLLGSIAAYGLLSFVIGLRWGYGFDALAALQPVLSTLALSLTVSAFRKWAGHRSGRDIRYLDIVLPTLGVALIGQIVPGAIGWVIIALFVAAGLTLGRLALGGADALPRAALDETPLIYRSLQATAVFFLLSALIDLAIDLDFQWTGGTHAARIVAIANLPALLALCIVAAATGRAPPRAPLPSRPAPADVGAGTGEEADDALLARLDAAMAERGLHRDPDLTLERLARKLAVPARHVSSAINRRRGQNVSQYVNGHRVAEAQRLLETTDRSVTDIMFEIGFQTKSNFNREFRRLASCSPSDWRARHRASDEEDVTTRDAP